VKPVNKEIPMDKPAFSETAPNELKELGYVPPIIKPYDKNGIKVQLFLDHPNDVSYWQLTMNGVQWMTLDETHSTSSQFYSHYKLAKGHVICTGLGFGTREQWIASKPEVTKVTVLEKFKEVINYHKDIGTKWSDKIEIINCDANDYKGNCDFLSIDHYEFNDALNLLSSIKKVCNNITCEYAWFWMLESWIRLGCIIDNIENPNIIPKKIHYGGKENDIPENYSKIKTYFEHINLPNLNKEQLTKFIEMYNCFIWPKPPQKNERKIC